MKGYSKSKGGKPGAYDYQAALHQKDIADTVKWFGLVHWSETPKRKGRPCPTARVKRRGSPIEYDCSMFVYPADSAADEPIRITVVKGRKGDGAND